MDPRLHGSYFRDDRLGDSLGPRQGEEVGEIAARDPGEREVLAIGGRLEALDDCRDLIKVGEIERLVGPNRKTDAVSGERNPADQVENPRLLLFAAIDTVINGDFERVEPVEILPRPFTNGGTIPDADLGSMFQSPPPFVPSSHSLMTKLSVKLIRNRCSASPNVGRD